MPGSDAVPLRLTPEEMEEFGAWLFIDLASRTGKRGEQQKNAMKGVFSSLSFGRNPGVPQPGRLRGSDFSRRLALWVHGWHRTGMTIQAACEKAAEVELVKGRFGEPRRGRRPKIPGGGKQESEETIRTCYNAVRKHGGLDRMVTAYYYGWFLEWKRWVMASDEKTLGFVAGLYPENGPVNAGLFLRLASKIKEKSSGIIGQRVSREVPDHDRQRGRSVL